MADFRKNITVVFDTGKESCYESIVGADDTDDFLCLRAEDGRVYALQQSRVLSMEVELQDDEKTAVEASSLFD